MQRAAVPALPPVTTAVLVEGRVQGAVAQGVGQALLEWGYYDDASGQLVAASFMDYAMPRADDLPGDGGFFTLSKRKGLPSFLIE